MTRTEKAVEAYDKYVMKTYPKADILFVKGDGCSCGMAKEESISTSVPVLLCAVLGMPMKKSPKLWRNRPAPSFMFPIFL